MTSNASPARTRSRGRSTFETVLLAAGLFLGGVAVTAVGLAPLVQRRPAPAAAPHPEAARFAAKYGPSQNSQFGEEWMIRDFFNGRRDGVFVDVGASDYREFNNTYYLETVLGWSGLAVDPLQQFEEAYRLHRPRTRFRALFVSDHSNHEAKIYFLKDRTRVTSSDPEFTARYGAGAVELTSPTITLNELLERENIQKIDFLSMDIELAEPRALAGFDIERFGPALVCIEAHEEVRQELLDYFARHRYVVVGKYLRADTQNLYFMPLPSTE
jgi:hypothetical protein